MSPSLDPRGAGSAEPAAHVPDVLPARHRQFPLLDSLRALAALSILVVHAAIVSGNVTRYHGLVAHLDIGVPFFFLLSAFLLYRPFVAARVRGTPRTRLTTYARRRFLRVMPAYWAALTIAAIVPGMAGAFSGNWWVYYGLLQNYPIYTATGKCAVDPYRCGLPPTWSLAVEIFFYAVLPFFVLLMDRLARGRRHWLAIDLGAVAVIGLASVWIQSHPPHGDRQVWLFFSPLGRGWWFGLGLALAAISVWVARREAEPRFVAFVRRHPGVGPALGVAAYLFASLVLLGPSPTLGFPVVGRLEYVSEYVGFGLIAALVILPAVFGGDGGGLTRRALAHPVLVWLGLVSYGIFLWQFPVLILLADHGPSLPFVPFLLVTVLGTILCAAGSYYLVERPLIRRGRRGGTRPARDATWSPARALPARRR